MAKVLNWFRNHMPTQRRLVQLYAALLYNAHAKGFINGDIYTGGAKVMCVPGLNCYSCPGAVGACPLGALQNAVASSGSRFPAYILGILALFGLILGRTICGWLCPVGLAQEMLHKIPTPKLKKNRATKILSGLKYVVLAVFVVMIPLWYSLQSYPLPAFCKYICPAGTFEGAVGLLAHPENADKFSMLGILFTRKFVILAALIAVCVFVYRAFCRFLCPLGAIYGMFARVAFIGVRVEASKCTDCGRCVGCCPMDISKVGDHECINCMKCVSECPAGAISMKAGKAVLSGKHPADKKSRRAKCVAWTAACVLLIAAFVYFNAPVADEMTVPTAEEVTLLSTDEAAATILGEATAPADDDTAIQAAIPVGYEPGMQAPDFSVPLYGEEGGMFTLSENAGRVVVLNFWATWCTPCCAELPHFDELAAAYPDDVRVIAVHSQLVTDDVEKYLAQYDYDIPFGLDETGEVITAFNGSTMLPQTVIIDADGIVVYNSVGSLDYARLDSLVKEAQK